MTLKAFIAEKRADADPFLADSEYSDEKIRAGFHRRSGTLAQERNEIDIRRARVPILGADPHSAFRISPP